jgi:hypothetical protein
MLGKTITEVQCYQCNQVLKAGDMAISAKGKKHHRYTCILCAIQFGFVTKQDLTKYLVEENLTIKIMVSSMDAETTIDANSIEVTAVSS